MEDIRNICNELGIDLIDNKNIIYEEYDLYNLAKDFNCKSDSELDEKIKIAREFNIHTIDRTVIFPTQDFIELDSLYSKYMALDEDNKAASDNKAVELFGKRNIQLYNFIMDNLIKNKSGDIDNHKSTEEENEHIPSIFSSDSPLLTPQELVDKVHENYSCFTESEAESIKRWRQEYALMGMGIKTENYNKYNLERINILRKAIYENNSDAIIQCGWIPGIEFNSENRVKASNIIREKMNVNNIINYDIIEESSDTKNKKAVSLVFVAGSSKIAKTIRKVQGTEFSHASISLDDDLSRIYSFNMRNGFDGFTYESVQNYIKEGVTKMGIYTFLVSDKVYKNLEKALDNFSLYINKTKYSILNLLTIPLNISLDMDMKMVCSEFVDKLLKTAELDLTNKKSSLVGPKDLIKAANTKSNIVEVFNGDPKKFKQSEVKKKIQKIKKSNLPIYEFVEYNDTIITEAKSFPVQFDSDGNLILKSISRINFEQEYADSHRLLKEYEKTKSYEPMKFELAKMQFFITLLEKRIYKNGKAKSTNEIKVRARFLNDFKKYLKIINTNEPNFNFTEYYEQSPFNDALIKIDKSTLKFGFEALKYLIK